MVVLDKKSALDESLLPSDDYNALPRIDSTVADVASMHEEARDELLQLISKYNVDEVFSVRLIHRHFDVPEGQVMVYETVHASNHPTFQIFSPRKVANAPRLRGKYFLAAPGGDLKAYEYTIDPLPDVSEYNEFMTLFSRRVVKLRMERVFALAIRSLTPNVEYHEIELPDLRATLLVQNSDWLSDGGVTTDWMNVLGALNAEGVPARQVGNGSKCYFMGPTHAKAGFAEPPMDGGNGGVLTLDGVPLTPGSDAFTVISSARQYISVT